MTNVTIIDGTGRPPYIGSVVLSGDKIEAVTTNIVSPSDTTVDLTGYTILPGLIDSHVHLQTIPGSPYRHDDPETISRLRKHHLKAYVASGVTTVLDAGASAVVLRDIQKYIANGGTAPRLLALGPVLYTPDGYLDSDFVVTSTQPARNEKTVLDMFAEYEELSGIVGVKVPIEYGFGIKMWPIHTPEMRQLITRISREKLRPIYVHATSEEEQTIGIEMGAHALVHSGFWDESPSGEFLALLQRHPTYVISTLAILETKFDQFDPRRLDDALLRLVVPQLEMDTAKDSAAWDWSVKEVMRGLKPGWLPDFMSDFFAPILLRKGEIENMLASAKSAIKVMYDRGVPIVIGTDSGTYPVVLNVFHGPSTLRELEILSSAGIPNMSVIMAASSVPAKMLGIDELVGTIETGKQADLIVTRGNPIDDISSLRKLSWVIKNGVMKKPAEWMSSH